jgi:nucleoside-diphosphate-sugar epimerase
LINSASPTLLLTGATGLVGGELLERLLAADPQRRIIALTRRPAGAERLNQNPNVTVVAADLAQPGLGLDSALLADLERSLTEMIHTAADIRFGLPVEQARAANVTPTLHLLELARRCRRLQKFAHISTVYVAGRRSGVIAEERLSAHNGFLNTYQQSKYEAEELVFRFMGEVPAVIFRLSSIIGDSTTGRVRQFNHVHQLLRLLPRNVLPLAPGDPQAPVDLISSDWAVAALAYLFENRFVPGRVYQLCAGPDASLTVSQMIDLTVDLMESHPACRRNGRIRLPKLVTLAEYQRFVEQTRRSGDVLLNELLRVLGYFLPHLGLFQAFENRNTAAALQGSGLALSPIRSYYDKVVRYCLDTDWGRRPERLAGNAV